MRTPVRSGEFRRDERSRAGHPPASGVHSPEAVFWDIGVALVIFLGVALTVSATLMAFGIN